MLLIHTLKEEEEKILTDTAGLRNPISRFVSLRHRAYQCYSEKSSSGGGGFQWMVRR